MQAVWLSIHSLGQRIAQMHFILQQKSWCWWTGRGCDIRLRLVRVMRMTITRTSTVISWPLILIGITVTWTRRRSITLIIEHNVIRRWRTFKPTSFLLQFKIQPTRLISSTNLMRRTKKNENISLLRMLKILLVVNFTVILKIVTTDSTDVT